MGDPVPSSAISDATTGGLSVIVITGGSTGQVLTLQSDGTYAPATVSGGSGDVVGPSSATDNAVARFDATTGKLIQNSGVTISDTNAVVIPGGLTVTGGGSSGTDGWIGGSYGGGFGGIWPSTVTPSGSNYCFLFNAFQTVIASKGGAVVFETNSSNRWSVRNDGEFGAVLDNTYDIGTSSSRRPKDVYIAGSVIVSKLMCSGVYTVATLPSAAANAYKFATVSDSSVTTFGSTVAGSGSSKVMVFSNGTNWTVCAA